MGSGIERFLDPDDPKPKPTAADRFARWEGAPDTARLKLSLSDARQSAPDTSARVLKAAQRTGLPADVVARNLDDVERDLRNVESEDFQRRFPRIASWLAENPHHATIATNDLERLARLEATIAGSAPAPREKAGGFRNFGKGLGLGIINLESGVGHGLEAVGQTLRATPMAGPMKALGAAQVVIGDYLRKDAKPAAEFYTPRAASMADIEGRGDLRDFIAFQAGQGIGTMAPMVIAGTAGVVGTAMTSGALNYGDVRDELETLAPEMATGVRNALALAITVPITALDMITPGQIAAKLIVRGAAKPLVTEAAKHGLTRSVLGAFLKTGAKEGGQEFVQEIAQYVGTRATTGTPMDLKEGAVRGADAFVGGALGGATFGAIGAVGERAQQNAAVLQSLDDVTKDAELPKLMAEKAEEVIARATDGASVYVPIGDWQEFHQGVGLDPGVEAERVLGDRAAYEEAIRTGEDLAIPMARYAVRVPSEHKAKLKDVVRVALDAMNAKESAEAVKAAGTEAETVTPDAADVSAQEVADDVVRQLVAAGVSEAEATTDASLYAAGFRALAARAGTTPMELYRRYNPVISNVADPNAPAPVGAKISLAEVASRAIAFRESRAEQAAEREAIQSDEPADLYRGTPDEQRDPNAKTADGEFVYARTAGGTVRSNLAKVAVDGIVDELARLYDANAVENTAMTAISDTPSTPTSHGYTYVGYKQGAAHAMGRVAARGKSIAKLEAELERRGVDSNPLLARRMLGDDATDFEFFQSAYHGSPHVFDKFTTDKMGTGEGAQSYGWGLYFSSLKEIARYYRETLTRAAPNNVKINGEMVDRRIRELLTTQDSESVIERRALIQLETANGSIAGAISIIEHDLRKDPTQLEIETWQKVIAYLRNLDQSSITTDKPGRLYKVEIPEDDTYLDWDKPLSQQSEHVKAALAKLGISDDPEIMAEATRQREEAFDRWNDAAASAATKEEEGYAESLRRDFLIVQRDEDAIRVVQQGKGSDIYHSFNRAAKQISETLASVGINGIRFLDQGSRAKGEGSHNYVVFDDKLIQIAEYEQRDERAVQRYLLWAAAAEDPALAPELRAHARRKADEFRAAATATRQAEIDDANAEQVIQWARLDEEAGERAQDQRLEAVAAGEGMATSTFEQSGKGKKPEPIRTGDRFIDAQGNEWRVFGTAPGGKVELFNEKRAWFMSTYTRDMRDGSWTRVASPNILYQEVPQTPDELDAAVERAFSESTAENLRGRIRIGPSGVAIDLFKAKNLSTFLHETGHFYLHILGDLARQPDIDPSIKADFDTIKMWLGKDDDTPFTKEQHEQFARGFEAYLMEGKAPSPALRTAFARFRAWLVSVYRTITTLNVQVSPEVSAVFDRMLATADEIDAARSQQNMNALDPAALGFDDAQTQKYLAAVEVERARAEEELSGQLMAEYQRTRTAVWEADRDVVRAEVAAEINQERDSLAYSTLTRGTYPDGSPLPEGSALKIDKASLAAHTAPEMMRRLPRYVYAKDGGMPIESVAEILGYDSADALLKALLTTENPKSRIERLTDQRMVEEHGLLTEAELPVEAMHAVHNEYRSKRLRMELEGLASHNLPALKGLVRAIAKRRIPQADAIRAQAEATIAAKRTSEINPLLYQRAEARAAKAALDALLKGDVELAFQEKSREWLNHELYRAAVEAKETVGKIRDEAVRLFRPDEQMAKSRDMDYVNAARAVAASFGLGSSTKPALSHLEGVRQYDPDLYATLAAKVEAATEGAQDYRAATYADLLEMRDAMNALWTLARSTRQHEVDGQKMDREEAQETLAARLRTIGLEHLKRGYQKAATEWEKTKVGLMGMRAALRRVESWVDAVDGGDPNGPFRRLFFNPVRESIDRFRLAEREARTTYLAIVKALEPSLKASGDRKIDASEIGYTFGSKAELLGALLHTGNESNFDKLLRGRDWTAVGWESFIRRMQLTGVLTKLDYDYAQAVWDLFETLKPGAQKAHHTMYGYYFSEITAAEVQTPFGTYRGGYVPARVDPFTSSDAQARADKEALEKENNSFAFPTTGRGFTKARVQAYARPLLMDLRMVPSHLNWMLRFTHIEPHVKSVSRMLWNREFRETLDGFDPTVVSDLLIPWLQRSARQTMATPGANRTLDRFFTHLRTNSAMGAMVGNVVNTVQQLTGFSISMVKVKPRYLRDALWRYSRSPKQVSDWISERSAFMSTRMHTQVDKVQSEIDDILLNPSKYEEARAFARRHGYILQASFQNLVDHVTWTGAYDQAIANGANERDAVREADSTVRLTQGSFNPEDASRFETGTPFMRLFSMFYGYFNMQANLLGSEFAIAMREMGLKKGAGRMLYVYTFGFLTVAVLSRMIVEAGRGDDFDEDDDGYMDDVLGLFFGSQWETATAFVPGVGAAARGFTNLLNDRWYDDRISVSPAIATIESVVKAPVSVYNAIAEGKSKKTAVRDFLTAVNALSGVPVAFLARPVGYLIDVDEGKARPENAYDFARGLVTGRTGTR